MTNTQHTEAPVAQRGYLRPILWLLLVISAAGNVVASTSALNVLVGIGFGLLTAGFAAALIVQHHRRRRR